MRDHLAFAAAVAAYTFGMAWGRGCMEPVGPETCPKCEACEECPEAPELPPLVLAPSCHQDDVCEQGEPNGDPCHRNELCSVPDARTGEERQVCLRRFDPACLE